MIPVSLAFLFTILFSWVQYLYVKQPGKAYVWGTGILIPVMAILFTGIWDHVVWIIVLFLFSLLIQWLFYALFFRSNEDSHEIKPRWEDF